MIGPQKLGSGMNPPSVASAADGRAAVAWVSEDKGVYVAERLPGADAFAEPRRVGSGAQEYLQPGTAVAVNERGEMVVLFATGYWNDQQLWSARRDADGAWHDPEALAGPTGEAVWRLHAALSVAGEAVFAWLSWDPGSNTSAWTAIDPPDGPAQHVRRLQAPGNRGTMPSIAMDRLGNAIVVWTEQPGDESVIVGNVYAAVRAPGAPFGSTIDLRGSTDDLSPAAVGLAADGHATVAWRDAQANGAWGGSLGGLQVATGMVPAGAFTRPEPASPSGLIDTPLQLAADPFGNAAVFFVDWDTGEQRVVRRSVAGLYGQERAVGPCPRTRAYPVAAAVDPVGNATSLWTDTRTRSGMWLSHDQPAARFSPDPCPAPPPPLTWTPKDPAPGERILFDASGYRAADATETRFRWDMDDDGTFELSGSDPTASHVFTTAGEHRYVLEVKNADENGSSTCSMPMSIRVGSPPEPPNDYPRASQDERPRDLPDETPWPIGSAVDLPPIELPELPLPAGGGLSGARSNSLLQLPPTIPRTSASAQRPGLRATVPRSVRGAALVSQGVPVRLTMERTGVVRVSASVGRKAVGGPTEVRVIRGRVTELRLRLNRAGTRLVRARKAKVLTLEAVPATGGGRVRAQVRVR
jgi:hypothetical protein